MHGTAAPVVLQAAAALCGCVSGAAQVKEIENMLSQAGFTKHSVEIDEESSRFIREWFPGRRVENYVRSAKTVAVKKGD